MYAYPIVSSDHLSAPANRGFLGMGRKRRHPDELPRAGAHEVWVYRVDGRYIVDRGELQREDDQVLRADLVSLVNMGDGVPISVDLSIPSAEASDFTVRVTFACTVTDPGRVVRENLNAHSTILAYLRRDSKLSHLALEYRMADVNRLRRDAAARVRAYEEVRPPDVSGMQMRLVGVEVLTPKDLETFEAKRRQVDSEHQLEAQKRGYRQSTEIDDELHTQNLTGRQREGRHQADQEEQEHSQVSSVRQQRHEHRLQAEQWEFARREIEFAFDAYGKDPVKALIYAQARGEINAKELAERMDADNKEQQAYRQKQFALDRDDDRKALEFDREDTREDRRVAREEKARQAREAREDRLRESKESREDRLRDSSEEREDRNRQLELKLEVLRELARKGHLDMVNVSVDQLVADISGAAVTTPKHEQLAERNAAAPIEGPKSDGSDGTGDGDDDGVDLDMDVREEDD
ncbi:MAG TPA: hypothetical protein VK453_17750 [Micromonosporaceae bacterium]|nr:hypothetical protein [Micromonosporaceae bacterium]